MTEPSTIPTYDDNHYAVVDLGSNSFHLLITHLNNGSNQNACPKGHFSIVNKVKRKVRLASGLDANNELSDDAITRGLDCLTLFALHLKTIPAKNIKIVATAALRIATNNQIFLEKAKQILPKPIELLSGEQEAQTIYAGVAYTSSLRPSHNNQACKEEAKRLVLDIGGASTEIIVGQGYQAKALVSLNIGCVSFKKDYFKDDLLTEENFAQATLAASQHIKKIADKFTMLGWQNVVGSSGTMQALGEVLYYRQQAMKITLPFLYEIQQALITCQHIDNISIEGLREDRAPVLASGLSILIALFTCLDIDALSLSSGALREGLLFDLLVQNNAINLI